MQSDLQAVLENLKEDSHELICDLLCQKDPGAALKAKGFELNDEEIKLIENHIKKMRTYITDQIHIMELKLNRGGKAPVTASNSGNGPYW